MFINANALNLPLADNSVHCIVTSPPYFGLRDYGVDGQIGLEQSPAEYVASMVTVFRECWRVLRNDGTLWINLGDTYSGGGTIGRNNKNSNKIWNQGNHQHLSIIKPKNLIGIPWRVAFALQDDGWFLRSDIIWNKPNPMPESVTDRPTRAHEYVFLLTKSAQYFYNTKAIAEKSTGVGGGKFSGATAKAQIGHGAMRLERPIDKGLRNARSVWTFATPSYSGSHFAVMPLELAQRCILAGSPVGGLVFDPFGGAGTTAVVAAKLNRRFVSTELNMQYIKLASERLASVTPAML